MYSKEIILMLRANQGTEYCLHCGVDKSCGFEVIIKLNRVSARLPIMHQEMTGQTGDSNFTTHEIIFAWLVRNKQ